MQLRLPISLSAAMQRFCGNFPKVFPVYHLTGSPVVWFPLHQQAGPICSRSTAKLEADVMICHASVLLSARLLMPRCHPSSTAPVPSGPKLPPLPPPLAVSLSSRLRDWPLCKASRLMPLAPVPRPLRGFDGSACL